MRSPHPRGRPRDAKSRGLSGFTRQPLETRPKASDRGMAHANAPGAQPPSTLAQMLRHARCRTPVPLPRAQVLDVRAGLRGMRTRQRVLAGRVPLQGEEVEAALIAEDVQLLGQVGAVSPAARSLSLTAREVETTSRALAECFPSRHLDRLRIHWKPTARPHAGPDGPPIAGLSTQPADPVRDRTSDLRRCRGHVWTEPGISRQSYGLVKLTSICM